ncbi:Pycsar system effector family protein [Aquibium microcysteis]|uniref:Pycsar system effector family protein n=1 Tax=Aquibium microcysteis TaxID=675281 RepID=UPI00165D1A73|nr:Pycsar system effector family protein [Aquibium microcysteis]
MARLSEYQDQLNRLLDLAHHQVHFAEAKNGALITLNFALIVGMAAISGEEIAWQWRVYMFSVGATLGLAGIVAMLSFLPRLTPIPDEVRKIGGNVAFTGDIAMMGSGSLLLALKSKMVLTDDPTPYCRDLAEQTYVNARIAATKFRRFRLAMWLTVGGFLFPTVWIASQAVTGALTLWS